MFCAAKVTIFLFDLPKKMCKNSNILCYLYSAKKNAMKKYKVLLTLSNGDKIEAKVDAHNQAHALERIENTEQVVEFVGNEQITNIQIETCDDIESVPNFVLQPSKTAGWYVLTDPESTLCAIFQGGKFNDTVEIKPIDDDVILDYTPTGLATILRQMSDYLQKNYPDLI